MSEETNQTESADESPVLNPPHAFSEGEEVITPDGSLGKVVSIDATDPANVRFEVLAPSKKFYAAADLQKE